MKINKCYNENNLDTMFRMSDEFVDLTVTSPPYDGLREYNGYTFDFESMAKELFRVTKQGGVVVWVVGDATIDGSETGTSFRQALFFMECGFNLHDTMIYEKDNPPPTGGPTRYDNHFEFMFVFTKGKPKTFNPIKQKRRNKHGDKRTERTKGFTREKDGSFSKKKVKINTDVKLGNIWKYTVGGGNVASEDYAHEHPAIFPELLVHDHIFSWSNEGDLVFDPFCGSGTTPKVAIIMKRKWIASEISPEYCEIINKRTGQFNEQPFLL